MSTAIAIRGFQLAETDGYEPVSDGSRTIQRQWAQQRNVLERSASDWLPTIDVALRRIRSECRTPNWDGQGASAVTDQSVGIAASIAEILFALLPKGTPAPDLIPEADGEICISWIADGGTMFSLSVGAHGKINFAGQFGRSGGVHAWQRIDTSSRTALQASLQDVARYIAKLYAPAVTRRAA